MTTNTVLVTGGTVGIGRAAAIGLVSMGAQLSWRLAEHHEIIEFEHSHRASLGKSMSLSAIPCLWTLATSTGSMGIS